MRKYTHLTSPPITQQLYTQIIIGYFSTKKWTLFTKKTLITITSHFIQVGSPHRREIC